MSIASLSDPQLKRALNIASWTDVLAISPNINTTGISSGIAGSVVPPNSSGLTTTNANGVITLTNTVDGTSYNNTAGNIRYLLQDGKANTYVNVYSKSAAGGNTFTFSINPGQAGHIYPPTGSLPVGYFISIHIDSSCGQTTPDSYIIQYSDNALVPNITCVIGNTYTFMCFQAGVWTRM
jgi:hypothetical protein